MHLGRSGWAVSAAALCLSVGAARADAIDGDWCQADGRHMTIRGPEITTPGGNRRSSLRGSVTSGPIPPVAPYVLVLLWTSNSTSCCTASSQIHTFDLVVTDGDVLDPTMLGWFAYSAISGFTPWPTNWLSPSITTPASAWPSGNVTSGA